MGRTITNPEATISVCLPVRNGERFLCEAIESVLNQTHENFELLVSDDCSTDATAEIVKSYSERDERIKYWHNSDPLGLFENYNKCMSYASTEIIKTFAQDDLWKPDLLARQYQLLKEHDDVALVTTRRSIIDENGHLQGECTNLPQIIGSKSVYQADEVFKSCLFPVLNLIGEPCAVMFRSQYLDTGFSTVFKHLGDLEFWLRILKYGNLGFIDDNLSSFRQHNSSATTNNVSKLWVHTDLVHLADSLDQYLKKISFKKSEFIENSLPFSVRSLPRLSDGTIDFEAVDDIDVLNPEDYKALKSAFLHALSLVSKIYRKNLELDRVQIEIERNERRIMQAEEEVRALLRSFSWRTTRLFRELNSNLISQTNNSSSIERIVGRLEDHAGDDENSAESKIASQLEYLKKLNEQKESILASRSWQITRFLRSNSEKQSHEQDNLEEEVKMQIANEQTSSPVLRWLK